WLLGRSGKSRSADRWSAFPRQPPEQALLHRQRRARPAVSTSIVAPAIEHYRKIGVTLDYRPQAGAGHHTRWWPDVKEAFEQFGRQHPRNPLPDTLTWETADASRFNRAHWLVIDELGAAPSDASLDDPNLVDSEPRLEFGVLSAGNRITRVVRGSNA